MPRKRPPQAPHPSAAQNAAFLRALAMQNPAVAETDHEFLARILDDADYTAMSPNAFLDWIIAAFDVNAQAREVLKEAEMLNDPNAPPAEGKETPLSAEAQADLLANTARLIAKGYVLAATRAPGELAYFLVFLNMAIAHQWTEDRLLAAAQVAMGADADRVEYLIRNACTYDPTLHLMNVGIWNAWEKRAHLVVRERMERAGLSKSDF